MKKYYFKYSEFRLETKCFVRNHNSSKMTCVINAQTANDRENVTASE